MNTKGIVVTVALAGALILHRGTAVAAEPAPASSAGALATLRVVDKDSMKVLVTSFDGTKLFYREPSQPEGVAISIPVASLEKFVFEFTYDEEELNKALVDQNWNRVCVLLWPVVSPALPYLAIKNNNAPELAMMLGDALVKAAKAMQTAKMDEEKVGRVYQRACNVYAALGAAEWCPDAESARLKAVLCLIAMKSVKQAEHDFRALRVPEIGDQTMGLYWYTLAALREIKGDYRSAMDALVKSIAFEDKDIDVFPDALMMSARLYESLMEPYRARDVYYEVARLFPETEWSKVARVHLQSIFDQKLTDGKEVIGIERTFFGLDEDVNAKASALLKGTLDQGKPDAEGSLDAEGDEKPAASGDEDKTAESPKAPAEPPEARPAAPAVEPKPAVRAPVKSSAKASGGATHKKAP